MISYPVGLPQPSLSFMGEESTPVARTGIKGGLIVQEGRYSNSSEMFSANWMLTKGEFIVFEEFFNETLKGGVLLFGLLLPQGGAYIVKQVRFVGGTYISTPTQSLYYSVSAGIECLSSQTGSTGRTPPVPVFRRLSIDPVGSQNLTTAFRNSTLTVRPSIGNQITLRIYPPVSPAAQILFGLNNQGQGETLITSIEVPPYPVQTFPSFFAGAPRVNIGFSQGAIRDTNRVEMVSGHIRQTLTKLTTEKSYQVEWEFDMNQLQAFKNFFYEVLKGGSLPFNLSLPVDSLFGEVPVKIIGGKFKENYVPVDRWQVSCALERLTSQTVAVSDERPSPVYYYPTVEVFANRKITISDAGKLFVINPAQGQTISLHIYALNIEFGVLVIGLGNVLVTRGGFVVLSSGSDSAGSSYFKPSFELGVSVLEIGNLEKDFASSSYIKPIFQLVSVVNDVGTLEKDIANSSYIKPSFEMKTVQISLAALTSDLANSSYTKPIFELIVA